MNQFLLNIFKLSLIVIILLATSLFFIPDVVAEKSLLAALPKKNQLLEKAGTGKIVCIGGSNVAFGLDSKKISEKLNRPVINMGIHAGLGLEYMINDVAPYVKSGDIIVLLPEYEHFFTDNFYGEIELMSILFSIDPSSRKTINTKQWTHLIKYIPSYSSRKLKNYMSYLLHKDKMDTIDIYGKYSFNKYGDAYLHWTMPNQPYVSVKKLGEKEKINTEVVDFVKKFKQNVEQKNAKFVLLPPVIEEASFTILKNMIDSIDINLQRNNIPYTVKPERYNYTSNYFFNTYYHLNKKGVDLRTEALISTLETIIHRP